MNEKANQFTTPTEPLQIAGKVYPKSYCQIGGWLIVNRMRNNDQLCKMGWVDDYKGRVVFKRDSRALDVLYKRTIYNQTDMTPRAVRKLVAGGISAFF